ncbi:MAG: NAD(P)-dependent alcohol dehydrogenase [Thermoplasmata archaeon]|nr:NAD(P)-dependent alcohol dehydrogenase [Thermoplasmata archaeon]
MKAIVQDRYGSAGVLKLEDVAAPVPDSTSVLLKVRSASVNGLDWRILSGSPLIARLFFGLVRPKPRFRIRGVDVAGEVLAVRKADSRFKAGDSVFGLGSGSFAELVAADESELAIKPEGVSFDDASTLGVAAFTALQGLRDWAELRPGQSVAVTGAGSGVGTFAVQIAKWMGARVTAITGTENVELLRSLGVDAVVDSRKEDFTRAPDRYDVILDVSGLNSLASLLRTLRPGGILAVVGGRGGIGRLLSAGLRRKIFRQRVRAEIAKVKVGDLSQLGELVAQGKIKPVIDGVYALREVPQAMARAELHRARGKLVVHVV